MKGSFVEIEYPGVATKYIKRDMINCISSSPYRVSISLSGSDNIKPTETMTFETKEVQELFVNNMIACLSEKDITTQLLIAKVNKNLAESLCLVSQRINTFKDEMREEVSEKIKELAETMHRTPSVNEAIEVTDDEDYSDMPPLIPISVPEPEEEEEEEEEEEPLHKRELKPEEVNFLIELGMFVFCVGFSSVFTYGLYALVMMR
jgi:hypothetical protein